MKKRVVALIGIILFLIFTGFLVSTNHAFGLKDFGDIREELEDNRNLGCEYITIEDGKFAPVNFRVETDKYNPTFSGFVEVIGGDAEFSSETVVGDDESQFRFATESIAEYRITLRDDMQNRTDIERNFYYRWEVSDADNNANIEQELGSWFSNNKAFCKVIEFVTEEPFKERTEEEILEITEKERRERDMIVDEKLEEVSAGLVILSVVFVVLTSYVLGSRLFRMFFQKKPESEASKWKKALGTELTRLQAMYEYGGKWFSSKDLEFEKWKQMFVTLVLDAVKDAVKNPDKSEFNWKPKKNPYLEMKSKHKGLNLRNFVNELQIKLKTKEKDPKAEFIEELENADEEELNEIFTKYQEKASKDPYDEDSYWKSVTALQKIKERKGF